MYWNYGFGSGLNLYGKLEPTHMMYWNKEVDVYLRKIPNLNRHIWCIETLVELLGLFLLLAWTDTYDVLKLLLVFKVVAKHITWTDTYDVLKHIKVYKVHKNANLNRHIWCIETRANISGSQRIPTWTDTYDVLKQTYPLSFFIVKRLEPTHMMYWNSDTVACEPKK